MHTEVSFRAVHHRKLAVARLVAVDCVALANPC